MKYIILISIILGFAYLVRPIQPEEAFNRHNELLKYNCYEVIDNYAGIRPTDMCLGIAYGDGYGN